MELLKITFFLKGTPFKFTLNSYVFWLYAAENEYFMIFHEIVS